MTDLSSSAFQLKAMICKKEQDMFYCSVFKDQWTVKVVIELTWIKNYHKQISYWKNLKKKPYEIMRKID